MASKPLYRIRVDITEAATDHAYPVVTHLFHGRTPREALRYFAAHCKTDAFLRGCVERGRWSTVRCRARVSASWVGGRR